MALVPSGSRNHHIQRMGEDFYRLSWSVYSKYGRMLYPRQYRRDTDRAGAERFAKKWGVKMPTIAHTVPD